MSGITLPLRTAILRHIFHGDEMPTPPLALYVAAFTAAGEVSAADTGYARVRVAAREGWTEPDELGAVANTDWIDFAPATGSYSGQVVRYELYDAAAGGTSWASATLPEPVAIIRNDQLRIKPGALTFTLRERSEEAAS